MHIFLFRFYSQLQGGKSFLSAQVDGQKFVIAQMAIIIITKACKTIANVTLSVMPKNSTKPKTIDVINLCILLTHIYPS